MWNVRAGVQTFYWHTAKLRTRGWKGWHSLVRPCPSTEQGLTSWQLSLNLKGEMISIYAESVVRDMVLFFGISSPIMNGKDLASTTVKTQSRDLRAKLPSSLDTPSPAKGAPRWVSLLVLWWLKHTAFPPYSSLAIRLLAYSPGSRPPNFGANA